MKFTKIIIAAAVSISATTYAQKDELKALKKIYDKDVPTASDLADFKTTLSKLEPLATEEVNKIYYNYYKAILPQIEMASFGAALTPSQLQSLFTMKVVSEMSAAYKATLDYEKKSGKKVFTDDINEDITALNPIFMNVATALGKAKRDVDASKVFYAMYQLDPKDQENLYYAASYAVNGQDYDKALQYYQELKAINYTGEGTLYYAYNKANRTEEYFTTKEMRDSFIKVGTHEKPRDENITSRKGEIYKNLALILVNKGKTEEAKQAFAEAKKANPTDISLLISEADLYMKLNDFTTYDRLISEALQTDPNNAELLFNLGFASANADKLDAAETYYKKAIEIDPKYFNAYLNLAELKMRSDKKYVDEINKLGTSDKELKRYDVLKKERNKNFETVLPLLETAVELKPEDESAKKTLLSLYNALEMTDKYKALKAKM